MPGFEDSALIVLLALLLFGPKKLPELARQFGKLMADFRRASSEFRTQMEDELRISEQAERQKKIAAEAAAMPVATLPATAETSAGDPAQDNPEYTGEDLSFESSFDSRSDSEFESSSDYPSDSELESTLDYPHESSSDSALESAPESTPHSPPDDPWHSPPGSTPAPTPEKLLESTAHSTAHSAPPPASSPLPIATIGEMSILPPSTGLPAPHTASEPLSVTVPAHRDASETEALDG